VQAEVQAETRVEPQPVAVEPQPVAVEAQPVAVEAQPVAVEAQPVAVEAPVVAAPAPVATAPAAAREASRQNGLSAETLQPVLEKAGLVWVNTDVDKLRAAQEAAAQSVKPARVVRERKPLPPVDSAPMQQVETGKDSQ
jgi:ribonuclease E